MYFQTGDLLYKKQDKKPTGLKEIKSGVILHSDTTGHNHKVKNGKLYTDKQKQMWIVVSKRATLTHEEHNDLFLPKGIYKVEIVREYDHMLEESRNVVD
jgi:hypothetical protein